MPLNTLAYAINVEAAEINRRAEVVGNYLIQAKEQLPDDTGFMDWVSENCPFSHSTALGLMKYARGLTETPALIGKPKSIVLEVMKLPAAEREEFIEENDGKSVREVQKLIKERDEARQQEELAKQAYEKQKDQMERFSSNYEKMNDLYHEEKQKVDLLEEQIQCLQNADPETITVEVAPSDYDKIKEIAQSAEQQAEAFRRSVREAEEYAEEQERLRKQAQSELRRIRDGAGERGNDEAPFSPSALSTSFQAFLGDVGTMPHMSAFFRSMKHEDLHSIKQWLAVFSEWLDGATKAVDEGFKYVSDCESSVE